MSSDHLHDVPPVLVHRGEPPSLLWHLAHDVGRGEDRLEVQPGSLHLVARHTQQEVFWLDGATGALLVLSLQIR